MKLYFVVYKEKDGIPRASELSLDECQTIYLQKDIVMGALLRAAPDAVYQAKGSRVWVVAPDGEVLVDTYRESREV